MSNETTNFQSQTFPFPECLTVLERAGKKIYGSHFRIIEEDHPVIFKLLVYFLKDTATAKETGIDHKKGILLTGPIGCGKTSLMNLMRYISAAYTHHIMLSCRKVSFEFIQEGYSIIQKYSDSSFRHVGTDWEPKTYCFDDLGAENTLKYFGNDCNVMAEILLSRYDYFISHGMITHLTTNLNSTEIESLYGNRVRSRLREMVNLISFDFGTDKRC
jgi:energy-coupling factor transporter ATP-binding protein EcfA2